MLKKSNIVLFTFVTLFAFSLSFQQVIPVRSQDNPAPIQETKVSPIPDQEKTEPKIDQKQTEKILAEEKKKAPDKKAPPTVEQIAETVIVFAGSRQAFEQIRRNGIERGKLSRTKEDGQIEVLPYERRFVRGESSEKEKIRVDYKVATGDYSLVYSEGQVWGLINGTVFTPRQDAMLFMLSEHWHGPEALLRYKENGSTLKLIGKEKQKNLNLWVLEVTDKENRSTRYYISGRLWRISWLEYEEPSASGGDPVKYRTEFHDYRPAQNTLVPYRVTIFRDSQQILEAVVSTVSYAVKIEDNLFENPEKPVALQGGAK
ncbi:MAG: hypothetical protein ACRD4L_06490 [Pyrinomonadaceae bacterium]